MDGVPNEATSDIQSLGPPHEERSSNAASFLKNSFMLALIGLSVSVLGVVYRVYMARYLGDTVFGTYVWITVFVSYFSVVSLFGFRQVIVRLVASAKDAVAEYTTVGLRFRLISGSLAVLLVAIAALLLRRTDGIELLVIIAGASLLLVALKDMIEATFLGMERSEYSAIAAVASNLLKIIVGIYLLTRGYGLLAILLVLIGTSLLNLVLSWLFLRYKCGIRLSPTTERTRDLQKYVFREAVPFVWVMLITKVYAKNDILVLGWLKGDQVVGWYGGAYMVVDFLLLIGSSIANAIYPIFSRMHAAGAEGLQASHERVSKCILIVMAPICMGVSIGGPSLLLLILGSRFERGSDALRIVVWMVLFETLSAVSGSLMAATGNQKLMAKTGAVSAAINLSLVLALVPRFSYIGAAWATVIGSVIQLVIATWAVSTIMPGMKLHKVLWRPLSAIAVAGGLTLYVCNLTILWPLIGIVAYALLLMGLRVIDDKDKATIGSIVSAGSRRIRKAQGM